MGLSITDGNGRTVDVPLEVEAEGGTTVDTYVREQLAPVTEPAAAPEAPAPLEDIGNG